MANGSAFIVSLDFELLWGVRDHAGLAEYGDAILGERVAIPGMLDLFERHRVHATWAVVGMALCRDRDELMAALPPEDLRPAYLNRAYSSYTYLNEIGPDEERDPYYFGMSLIERVRDCPGQEIATHTFSHFYCLEEGATPEAFQADIDAAKRQARQRGIDIRSIIFPRNQYGLEHLEICKKSGISAYRGNPTLWAYRPAPGAGQTAMRRALRLIDAHSGVLGDKSFAPDKNGEPRNVPASQFLRPNIGRLGFVHPLHLNAIKSAMTSAAREGRNYHLWWHPHNFGRKTRENLAGLENLLRHFAALRDEYGMTSRNMMEMAA